jgi:argininosuccinate lyase
VGVLVKQAETAGVPLPQLPLESVQAVNKAFAADWIECFDLGRAMRKRERTGMPGPRQVVREIARWRKGLANHPA